MEHQTVARIAPFKTDLWQDGQVIVQRPCNGCDVQSPMEHIPCDCTGLDTDCEEVERPLSETKQMQLLRACSELEFAC